MRCYNKASLGLGCWGKEAKQHTADRPYFTVLSLTFDWLIIPLLVMGLPHIGAQVVRHLEAV